jgi:hypothetical protein
MTRSTISRSGTLTTVFAGMLALFLVLMGALLGAGCLEPYPPEGVVPPAAAEETSSPTQPIQTVPPTIMAGRGIQAEAPVSGYIERSYGYVPYTPPPDHRITYIDASGSKDPGGMVTITGRIKNEGPGSLNYLHVTYTLFDSNGNIIGNAHASVEYLSPGKTWRFTTEPVKAGNYQYFELTRVLAQ